MATKNPAVKEATRPPQPPSPQRIAQTSSQTSLRTTFSLHPQMQQSPTTPPPTNRRVPSYRRLQHARRQVPGQTQEIAKKPEAEKPRKMAAECPEVEETTTKTPDTEDAVTEPPETTETSQEKKIPAKQTEESEPRRPCRSRKPPDRLSYSQLGTPGVDGR